MPRGVLFVHNNFPGQFADLAATLVARGTPCAAIAQTHARGLEGVTLAKYSLPRGTTPGILPTAVRAEADLIRAAGAHRVAKVLQARGWDPAVIVVHPGWGEGLFLREVFPQAKVIAFAEFFYHGRGYDVGFDPEFMAYDEDVVLRATAKNLAMALSYADADAIVAPTAFQAGALPRALQSRARIIHEGVDTDAIRPGPAAPFVLADGRTLAPGAPVITHVNNHLEPLRGLHILARALPRLLAEVPQARVLIIGESHRKGYGGDPPEGRTWRDVCFEGVEVDPDRVHFLGRVPHERMLAALRLGAAHVYYSYPFVLSWSLAEAMASGCYVLASDTAPLHDAIEDGVNGRLLPFFDPPALAEAMIAACRDPDSSARFRAAARVTAEQRFSRPRGREAWLELLREHGAEISRS